MNQSKFNAEAQQFLGNMSDLLGIKGEDYAGTSDRLANFKENAKRLGITPFQVWAVYFTKHVDSVLKAIEKDPINPKCASEPLRGPLLDVANYALIAAALLVDGDIEENPVDDPEGEEPDLESVEEALKQVLECIFGPLANVTIRPITD